MAFDYSGLQATASRMIRDFGRVVTIRNKQTSGEAWNPSVTWQDSTASAVQVNQSQAEFNNTLIQASDRVFLIESAASIDTSSRVIDDKEYQVVQVSPLNPGDTNMLYRAILRS